MTICQSQVRAQYYALAHEGLQAQTQAEAEDHPGVYCNWTEFQCQSQYAEED